MQDNHQFPILLPIACKNNLIYCLTFSNEIIRKKASTDPTFLRSLVIVNFLFPLFKLLQKVKLK